ncbi:MAG TPA: L,D-transpeptidase family protein [Acidimicrobiales bacterium]
MSKAWRRVAALGLVTLVVAAVACAAEQSGGSSSGSSTTDLPTTAAPTEPSVADHPISPGSTFTSDFDSTDTTVEPSSTAAPPEATPLPAAASRTKLARTLRNGVKGDDVKRLQQRLIDLKFDPGVVDGIYGTATTQAVWAFQKLVMGQLGKAATGQVTAELWDRMQDPVILKPRRMIPGNHLEVYLPEQVAVLYKNYQPVLATHVSSGNGEEWCELGRCGKAVTPGGVFKFYRRESGWWEGSLGKLYNPVYFNYGIAVHGMTSVPNYPASHGCVRIPMHIAEYFPDLVKRGDRVYVWDGKKEPEAYGAQPPPWDRPDPNATTTSSSTASTSTTVKATTTTKAATTTTKATVPSTTAAATTTTAVPAGTTTTTASPPTSAP